MGDFEEAKKQATKTATSEVAAPKRKPLPKGSDGSKPAARLPGEKPRPKTAGPMVEAHSLRDLAEPAKNSSRQEPVFVFDPPRLAFDDTFAQEVRIHNYSGEPQTIDEWELVGDIGVFETAFVGSRSVPLAPGQSFLFTVRFTSEAVVPQTAALIARSSLADQPARLDLVGLKGDRFDAPKSVEADADHGVEISATTPDGRPNSIMSAITSVGYAWNAVSQRQAKGLRAIKEIASKEQPKASSGWKTELLNGAIGMGLSSAISAATLFLGGGLALAAWEAVESSLGRAAAAGAAKTVAELTLKIHAQVTGKLAQGIIKNAAQAIGEKLEGTSSPTTSSELRDLFFDAQSVSLAQTYVDAVTSLNNREGDYVELEREHAGLGFAALEAYRKHLYTSLGPIQDIQREASLGMWMAFLARLELGTHDPEQADHAKAGAALDQNLYRTTDDHHRLSKLASGVLELQVIWDYDRMQASPIFELQGARVVGVHPELKKALTEVPLGRFPLPLIVHGKVRRQLATGSVAGSHLGIARNEGGALWLGATANTDGAGMLEFLGDGDVRQGARKILEHVDAITLKNVD